jgi:hypothetical protein
MLVSLLKSFELNARFTSVLVLCMMSTFILISNMTEATLIFNNLTVNDFGVNDFRATDTSILRVEEVLYTPPNYGAPDSQQGGGTR